MAALYGAVPLVQMDDVAVLIRQYLELDMPGVLQVFLQVHVPVTKERLGLALRALERVGHVRVRKH